MDTLSQLVAQLTRPSAYPHPVDQVIPIETHISHVLLAGAFAYKLKKPLDLGFLDFSTLARRKFCCEEEVRLNRRLAPGIYLEVVPITGTRENPRLGGDGPVLEYAVKMRRFPQEGLLSSHPLTGTLPERIAERVARFHQAIPAAPEESPYGTPEAVLGPMRDNFPQLKTVLGDPESRHRLARLEDWTQRQYRRLEATLGRRKADGFVRECHGDMHRGNIALVEDEILIFDGIEFDPGLRWIDTMSELAFLMMDLDAAGESRAARRILNRYLEETGDYGGLAVLDFYRVYRALVRAKIAGIRLEQGGGDRARREVDAYLQLAERFTQRPQPALYLTHGFSGSGKSWFCQRLRAEAPLIHIRSDLERQRLFSETEGTGEIGAGRYGPEATERTYAHLRALAQGVLDAGYSPLIDATFLGADQRAPFLALGKALGVPCHILHLQASEERLRARIRARREAGTDPSEADVRVLEWQLARYEPLNGEEAALARIIDTEAPEAVEGFLAEWAPERPATE